MESKRIAEAGLVALAALTVATVGIAAAAGTTDVMLSPENETVEPGTTVTYDVVVAEAAGGVGSFEATVSTNDSSVATVRGADYADDPAHASEQTGAENAELSATGMDTLDDGPVEIATVTVRAESDGVARLSLSVAALGDEQGRSYDVAETRGRTLAVGDGTTPTPTDGSGSEDDEADPDDDDGNSGDGSDSSTATPTATATPTDTATPTPTATPTDAPTATPSDTPTETATAANGTPTGGAAPSPSDTATPAPSDSGLSPVVIVAAIAVLLAVAGAAYWSLRD